MHSYEDICYNMKKHCFEQCTIRNWGELFVNTKRNILIVGGNTTARKELRAILVGEYIVKELADTGRLMKAAEQERDQLAVVLLGISSKRETDLERISEYTGDKRFMDIPLVIFSVDGNEGMEAECLRLGAWDYLGKNFDAGVVRHHIRQVVERQEYYRLKELVKRERIDALTGIYKKEQFIEETRRIIDGNREKRFAMIHFDIYKFHIFNTLYGKEDGDRLIKYIAGLFKGFAKHRIPMTYCHEYADIFYLCVPYHGEEELLAFFKGVRRELNLYRKDYDLLPSFGIYVVDDPKLSVQEMMGLARFAAKNCKGSYLQNYAFHTKEMSDNVLKEQFVLNNMNTALEKEHFVLYFQPKYDLFSNTIQGAEALVRWFDPVKGMISPGEFIPVFEKNGFITELDYYVWEHACRIIHKWMKEGHSPCPVSVNVSRISLYNPQLADNINALVKKYDIPPALLQLELTESAYTDNPKMIKDTMEKLHDMGFTILMDDFGSGYSSLNVLKDVTVDVLKIDMKFMEKGDVPGRSENILASVVRMAKWLNMPVIAEGVETDDQAKFLRSIGCEYVQGYYFAKPMPLEEYEQRAFKNTVFHGGKQNEAADNDRIWASNEQIETLFANMLQPVVIYEYDGGENVEMIRVNNAYYDMFGFDNAASYSSRFLEMAEKQFRKRIMQAFAAAVAGRDMAECEFVAKLPSGREAWIDLKLKYLSDVGARHIIFGTLSDITMSKEIDNELQRYKRAVAAAVKERQTILIVEDLELNRSILRGVFGTDFQVLEAENGAVALEMIKEHNYDIDIVLLDLDMPVMNGHTFLKYKSSIKEMSGIPVIIISANDSPQMQINSLSNGVSDYIVKPFVPEVVMRRVRNVLESNKRIMDALRKQ